MMPATAIGGDPVQTGTSWFKQRAVRKSGPRSVESAAGVAYKGLRRNNKGNLIGTADYRRFIDSTPPWAVEEVLGKVYSGHD